MYGCFAYIYDCALLECLAPWKPEDAILSLRTGVTYGCWGLYPAPRRAVFVFILDINPVSDIGKDFPLVVS